MTVYRRKHKKLKITALIFGLLFVFAPLTAHSQDNVQLSVADGRIVAQRALSDKNYSVAMSVANALLAKDPDDLQALLILAAGNLALGKYSDAFLFSKRAFNAAPRDNPNRFGAATVAARSLAHSGKFERAKIWMRRAIELAPSEKSKTARIREFRAIRRASPWKNSASFSIQPSDNVNNGTSEKFITLGGLEFTLNDSEPLTGLRFSLGADIAYRIASTDTSQTYVGMDLYNREVIITGDNDTKYDGRDFRYSYAGIYLSSIRKPKGKSLTVRDKVSLAKTWYGGDQLADRISISRSYNKSIDAKRGVGLYVSAARSVNQNDSIKNSTSLNFTPSYIQSFDTVGVMRLAPFISEVKSKSSSTAYTGYGISVSLSPTKEIFKTKASFSVGFGVRKDTFIGFSGAKRKDEYVSLKANFFVKNIQIFGFSPTVNIEARQNRSNVTLFNTQSLGFGIGFRSAF